MIDLVLNGARLVTVRLDAGTPAFLIERLQYDAGGARDVAEDVGNRQSPLLGRFLLVATLDDDRIDEQERRWILRADVHDRNAAGDAELIGREAHALRGAHRLEKIVNEPAHGVIHLRDRGRFL